MQHIKITYIFRPFTIKCVNTAAMYCSLNTTHELTSIHCTGHKQIQQWSYLHTLYPSGDILDTFCCSLAPSTRAVSSNSAPQVFSSKWPSFEAIII